MNSTPGAVGGQGRFGVSPPLRPVSFYNITYCMASISNIEKRSRGRPATDATPVMVRLPPKMITALDAMISGLPEPKPSRPEAIRQVLAIALNFVARDNETGAR
jgi:hypothetical protein